MCENEFYLFRYAYKLMLFAPKLILFVCLKGIVFVRYAEPGVKSHQSALRQPEEALKGINRIARLRAEIPRNGNFGYFGVYSADIRQIGLNIAYVFTLRAYAQNITGVYFCKPAFIARGQRLHACAVFAV